jgi:hypothetical protein
LKKLSVISILFLCLFVCTTLAHAVPYNYIYTGNYFTRIDDTDPPAGQYTTNDFVKITLTTIDGLLPESATTYDVSPYLNSWTFFDGRSLLVSGTASLNSASAVIDSNNVPTQWTMRAEFIDPGYPVLGNYIHEVVSRRDTDTIDVGSISEDLYYRDNGVSFVSGEWTVGAVPEPATILLLGSGLAGLAGFGRKKFKK